MTKPKANPQKRGPYDTNPMTKAQLEAARRARRKAIEQLGENPVTGTRLYEFRPSDVILLAACVRSRLNLSAGNGETKAEYMELLQRLEKQCA